MHHVGSTLGLMCFIMRAYKGGKRGKYFTFTKMLCRHKSLHIPVKNNYSPSRPFVCARFVVLTKTGGPFITMNGGETPCVFRVLYLNIFSHTQPCWIFGCDDCDLQFVGFMILHDPSTCVFSPQQQNRFCSQTLLYEKVSSPTPHFTAALVYQHKAWLQSFCVSKQVCMDDLDYKYASF